MGGDSLVGVKALTVAGHILGLVGKNEGFSLARREEESRMREDGGAGISVVSWSDAASGGVVIYNTQKADNGRRTWELDKLKCIGIGFGMGSIDGGMGSTAAHCSHTLYVYQLSLAVVDEVEREPCMQASVECMGR